MQVLPNSTSDDSTVCRAATVLHPLGPWNPSNPWPLGPFRRIPQSEIRNATNVFTTRPPRPQPRATLLPSTDFKQIQLSSSAPDRRPPDSRTPNPPGPPVDPTPPPSGGPR